MSISMSVATRADAESGFSLIEVLVALFILAVGLLGAGALQMIGVQGNQGAYAHSQAVFVAADMADRMRANPEGVANGNYDAVDTEAAPADPACAAAAGGCTTAQIAQLDIFEWNNSLVSVIPEAVATVARVAGTNNFVITLTWQEREWDADDPGTRNLLDQNYAFTVSL